MKYEIGGKTYIQKPLVLGQLMQLSRLLHGMAFSEASTVNDIIVSLGVRLSHALAIVLIPEGVYIKDKDISALSAEIEFIIDPKTTIKVVNDFFDCNPISSLLDQLIGMTEKIKTAIQRTNGTGSSASSPAEILPGVIASSGDTP